VEFVVNFDIPRLSDSTKKIPFQNLPTDVDTYLHRIGRTGRYDRKGISLTFYNGEGEEYLISEIENKLKVKMRDIKSVEEIKYLVECVEQSF